MALPGIYLEPDFLDSKAFKQLSKKQTSILLHFMRKRVMKKILRGKKSTWCIANNDEIIFSYSEAEKLGYCRKTFATAISKLIEVGFIDIAHHGNGTIKGDCSKYGLHDRWKNFGKSDFVKKSRPKDTRKSHSFDAYNESRKKAAPSTSEISDGERRLRKRLQGVKEKNDRKRSCHA